MFIRKKDYEELIREKSYAVEDRDRYKRMYDTQVDNYIKARADIETQMKKVEELQKKNDELQHKIDILYAYYDIQKEPTQEERTKIRLDLRVHELEMENLELRAAVNSQIGYLQAEIGRSLLSTRNSICNIPWPYCNAQVANLIHC